MRFISRIKLYSNDSVIKIPKYQYRASILSVIKHGMSIARPEMFEQLYKSGAVQKRFAYSVYLPDAHFDEGLDGFVTINVENGHADIIFTWSAADVELSEAFITTFMYLSSQKDLRFKGGIPMKVTLPKIVYEQPIVSDAVLVKTKSSILSARRFADRDKHKWEFYTVDNDIMKFETQLRYTLLSELKSAGMMVLANMVDSFSITPVQPTHSTHSIYELVVGGSGGVFMLSGEPELLNYICRSGLGIKRGLGFGLLEVL